MNTIPVTASTYVSIAEGDLVNLRSASAITAIPYAKLWYRVRREEVPTYRLNGRRYIALTDLQNPALRIP